MSIGECPFDYGAHQFYELDGTQLDFCKKCGQKKPSDGRENEDHNWLI